MTLPRGPRRRRVLLVVIALLVGLMPVAAAIGPARADPPTSPTAPLLIDALPLSTSAAITTTIPSPGARVQLAAGGYTPGESVSVVIGATTLARSTANAYGRVSALATIPTTLSGARSISLTGTRSHHTNAVTVSVEPLPPVTTAVSGGGSTSVGWWIFIGVVIVLVLGGLAWWTRRRLRPRSDHEGTGSRVGPGWRSSRGSSTVLRWSVRGIVVLVGVGIVWIAVTALLARSELTKVKAELRQTRSSVSAGDLQGAESVARHLSSHAHRANFLTSGPAWAVAAHIPWLGDPFESVRGLTHSAGRLGGSVVPSLIRLSDSIDPSKLRTGSGQIDIDKLTAAAPTLHQAATQMNAAESSIAGLPHHTWLSPVDSARTSVADALSGFTSTIDAADKAAQILPGMLGTTTPKRYFVAFLNPAQARGVGGIPGAFGILEADHGKITFTHFGNDGELFVTPTSVDLGPNYDSMYGASLPYSYYINSTMSAHFPYAAQILAAMWQKHSGQKVDGAVSIDPTALSYLLAVTGPARLPDGSQATSSNIVALTESVAYAKFPKYSDQAARKAFLLAIADAVDNKVLDATDLTGLTRAAARAASEQRLLVWSSDPTTEQILGESPLGGVIPDSAAPYSRFIVNSAAGGKLDYYLSTKSATTTRGVGSGSLTSATMILSNSAPASGLSPYVTYRLDQHPYATAVGDNRSRVTYYATRGAALVGASVNGRPVVALPGTERDHPTFTLDVEIPRGATAVVRLETVLSAAE